jgi:O-antigen/teichoic acid export membrane protein
MAATAAAAVVVGVFRVEPLKVDRATVRAVTARHLAFSSWLGGSAACQVLAVNFFFVAAASILGAAAAGAMKAARNIIGVTHILFMGLENVVPSEASRRLHEFGAAAMNRYVRRVGAWGMSATALFALVAAAAPRFWLTLFYGSEFNAYGNVLRWFAVIYVLSFLGTPLRAWLRAWEDTRPIFVGTMGMLVLSLATGFPFSRWWGLDGTMAGMFLAFVILQSTLVWGILRRRRETEKAIAFPAAASIAEVRPGVVLTNERQSPT